MLLYHALGASASIASEGRDGRCGIYFSLFNLGSLIQLGVEELHCLVLEIGAGSCGQWSR